MQEVAEFTDHIWKSVDKLKELRELPNTFEVLASWKGISTAGDSWEPSSIFYGDVPTKFVLT